MSLFVAAADLEQWAATVLRRLGAGEAAAAETARHLVFADLRGIDSHGTARLPDYVRRIEQGGLLPAATPRVLRQSPVSALVDGGAGLGHATARFATDLCIGKALAAGMAAVAVQGSQHCGCMGYYTLLMAEAGLVGLATTNSGAHMPPWGSSAPYFGTNPIAFSAPGEEEAPLCYDGATSLVAKNKIMNLARDGKPVPPGWAVDREGRPTADPVAAREGWVLPMGGYKGSGLAFMVDVLSATLTGPDFGAAGHGLYSDPSVPKGPGHFFWAFRPDLFTDAAAFRRRVDQEIRAVRSLPPAPGFTRVLAPGDPELASAAERSRHGIPLAPGVLEAFAAIAGRHGVPLPWSATGEAATGSCRGT